MLILGMGTEATIFFLSALDEPAKDYKWEKVYPELEIFDDEEAAFERLNRIKNGETPSHRRKMASQRKAMSQLGYADDENEAAPAIANNTAAAATYNSASPAEGVAMTTEGEGITIPTGFVPAQGTVMTGFVASSSPLTEEQTKEAAEATQQYVTRLTSVTEALSHLETAVSSLSSTENSADQMATLGRNIQGLNSLLEMQVKNLSNQIGALDEVNRQLQSLHALFENGQADSYRIRTETDRMANTLHGLNEVYTRMLGAMTIGYNAAPNQMQGMYQPPMGGAPYAGGNNGYPSQPYTNGTR